MLLELLKRDLRLHYGALLIPFVFALTLAGLHFFDPGLPMFGSVLGFAIAAFLPLVLHLREHGTGSLGDLAGLPVSREQIVQLRFLEAFLLPSALLSLSTLAIAILTRTLPAMPNVLQIQGLGWALIFCCAYYLPFVLRWDGKGLVAAFALLFGLGAAGPLLEFLPTPTKNALGESIVKVISYFGAHPSLHTLLLLGLFALFYQLSIRAFAARDL